MLILQDGWGDGGSRRWSLTACSRNWGHTESPWGTPSQVQVSPFLWVFHSS